MTPAPKAHRYRVTVDRDGDATTTYVWAYDASDARSIAFMQGLRGTITAERVDEDRLVPA